MKVSPLFLSLALFSASSLMVAQTTIPPIDLVPEDAASDGMSGQAPSPIRGATEPARPFSRIGIGAGISPLGVGVALFGPYLLCVELASVLLLAALVGAYRIAYTAPDRR